MSVIVLSKRICKLFPIRYFRLGVIFMPTGPTDWQKKNQDILKEAFNQAHDQQRENKAKKAVDDRRAAGSQMVKKDRLSPEGPTPPGATRHAVNRQSYNSRQSVENAKADERVKKAQAAMDDAKKRAAATANIRPPQTPNKAASQNKQNQQNQSATNHKMYAEINKAKAEITSKQPSVMVKSDFNKSSGGREGR